MATTFLIWQVLAYIEPDGTVGGPDMSYLGEVRRRLLSGYY